MRFNKPLVKFLRSCFSGGTCSGSIFWLAVFDVIVRDLIVTSRCVRSYMSCSVARAEVSECVIDDVLLCSCTTPASLLLITQEISVKVKELLNNLRSLSRQDDSGKYVITAQDLEARKMQSATRNFLLNLAAAEGLLKTSWRIRVVTSLLVHTVIKDMWFDICKSCV